MIIKDTKIQKTRKDSVIQPKKPPIGKADNLDTLAQLCIPTPPEGLQTLKKRSKTKYLANQIVFPLIDLHNEREKSYWTTYYCVMNLEQHEDGKITSTYCKQRWCPVCNRIRTAKLIKGYEGVILAMKEPRFVTLTIPNVSADGLREAVEGMTKDFRKILNRRRGMFRGIRKLEVTYNEETGEYHPHFHVILDGISEGRELIREWLQMGRGSRLIGQDERHCDTNGIIEVFKYFTKLWKKKESNDNPNDYAVIQPYPPEAMDVIFTCLYRKRTVQPFGGIKMVNDDFEDREATVIVNEFRSAIWTWEQEERDWINIETGEYRTRFVIQ